VGTKRISLAFLAGVLPALSAAPHAATLGVSMALFDDNFLTAVRASMKERAQQLNVPIQFEDAQNDIGRQLNQIQNFIAQKVGAIIVNPVDTDATPKMTRLAVSAGIPLVYVNRMPADKQLPPRVSIVGSDEAQSGTLLMAEVCRLLQGKGEIVILIGELTNQAARQRTQDIYDAITRPSCRGIRVLEKQTANWKGTQAADLMMNWLSAGLRPQAVVANDDERSTGFSQSTALPALTAAMINGTWVSVSVATRTPPTLPADRTSSTLRAIFTPNSVAVCCAASARTSNTIRSRARGCRARFRA
jgi:inositol transport system substrate-binding protein